jgi:hypothetical protein
MYFPAEADPNELIDQKSIKENFLLFCFIKMAFYDRRQQAIVAYPA